MAAGLGSGADWPSIFDMTIQWLRPGHWGVWVLMFVICPSLKLFCCVYFMLDEGERRCCGYRGTVVNMEI